MHICSIDLYEFNHLRFFESSRQDFSEGIAKIEDVITTIEKSVKSAISEVDKKKKV